MDVEIASRKDTSDTAPDDGSLSVDVPVISVRTASLVQR
jgi:hypothetical protein